MPNGEQQTTETSMWIKVQDQLPPPATDDYPVSIAVLVVLNFNDPVYGRQVVVGCYHHKQRVWLHEDMERILGLWSEVTHWMPLPELPND